MEKLGLDEKHVKIFFESVGLLNKDSQGMQGVIAAWQELGFYSVTEDESGLQVSDAKWTQLTADPSAAVAHRLGSDSVLPA